MPDQTITGRGCHTGTTTATVCIVPVYWSPQTLHRVEGEVVGEDRVTFREACEYPDGDRVVVETTLEVRDGMIVRQTDSVAEDARADAAPPDRLLSSKQAAEKED
jgi:hypothetical protein